MVVYNPCNLFLRSLIFTDSSVVVVRGSTWEIWVKEDDMHIFWAIFLIVNGCLILTGLLLEADLHGGFRILWYLLGGFSLAAGTIQLWRSYRQRR